jgi:hypothetical protein
MYHQREVTGGSQLALVRATVFDELLELLVEALAVVVDLAAVVLVVAAAAPVSAAGVEAAAVVTVDVAWRAMPSPRALAIPMLREATRARLRAAGWGRFGLMSRTYGPGVSLWFAPGESSVSVWLCPRSRNTSVSKLPRHV